MGARNFGRAWGYYQEFMPKECKDPRISQVDGPRNVERCSNKPYSLRKAFEAACVRAQGSVGIRKVHRTQSLFTVRKVYRIDKKGSCKKETGQ